MPQKNVEIVRGVYEALNRRDGETPFEVYAEDIVWMSSPSRAGVGIDPVYRGHDGVRRFWRDGLSVFGDIQLEVEDLLEAGDQVLAVVREREVGRASGVPVENTHFALWTLSEGKITRMQIIDERRQAFAAAGLTP
jgi:ketosteroid isomerase-like protein